MALCCVIVTIASGCPLVDHLTGQTQRMYAVGFAVERRDRADECQGLPGVRFQRDKWLPGCTLSPEEMKKLKGLERGEILLDSRVLGGVIIFRDGEKWKEDFREPGKPFLVISLTKCARAADAESTEGLAPMITFFPDGYSVESINPGDYRLERITVVGLKKGDPSGTEVELRILKVIPGPNASEQSSK
jgi:hypothetical protein